MKALPIVVAVSLVVGLPVVSSANPSSESMGPMPVAMGCGAGRTRDAAGRCHHRFDLFRHHKRFRAYKSRHCTKVRTANGPVNRCQI